MGQAVGWQAKRRQHTSDDRTFAAASLGVLRLLPSTAPSAEAGRRPGNGLFLGDAHVAAITGDVTAIGRDLRNAVVLLDPAVSREHALLHHNETGWRIENISSQQPLFVNEQEVLPGAETMLAPGDMLRIGASRLQLLAPMEAPTSDLPLPAMESGSIPVLSPGVTLQFALGGKRHPRLRWLLLVIALALLAASGLATFGTAALAGRDALANGGLVRVLAALTIPLIPALGVTLLIALFDRYEREPWLTLSGAFIWGALIAIPPTLLLERALSSMLLLHLNASAGPSGAFAFAGGQAIIAGVIEEAVKGAGLVLLLLALRDEFDNVTDGILYGLLIGAGFAIVENFVYFALSPNNELPFLVLARIVLGWLSHSTFTALFGAGLGYARECATRPRRRWLLFPLLGLFAAILLHTFFDFVVFGATALAGQNIPALSPTLLTLCTLLLGYGPLFLAQAVLLRLLLAALDREAETVRAYLSDELLAGVVLPDEYLLLQDARLRSAAERRIFFDYGLRAYLTARAFYQAATGLAFRKWHVAQGDRRKNTPQQPEDVYRERLARLRLSLYRQMK